VTAPRIPSVGPSPKPQNRTHSRVLESKRIAESALMPRPEHRHCGRLSKPIPILSLDHAVHYRSETSNLHVQLDACCRSRRRPAGPDGSREPPTRRAQRTGVMTALQDPEGLHKNAR